MCDVIEFKSAKEMAKERKQTRCIKVKKAYEILNALNEVLNTEIVEGDLLK